MMSRSLLLKILSAAIVFGAWEIAGWVPVSYAFPTFFESMSALLTMTLDGTLFAAYAETLKPLVIGIIISAFIGIAVGLWIGLSSPGEAVASRSGISTAGRVLATAGADSICGVASAFAPGVFLPCCSAACFCCKRCNACCILLTVTVLP